MSAFVREDLIAHALAPHYAALRAIGRRAALHRSPLWAEIGGEVERVCGGVEIAHHAAARRAALDGLRAVAWNVQRGARLDAVRRALRDEPGLAADLHILVEVDSGMARSGNLNVARALAEELGESYAFAPSYLALEDDHGENLERRENQLALAGVAILSRLPILGARSLDLPELRDKFSSREKRLGRKRALAVTVDTQEGPLTVVACHLDANASPLQRARQLDAALAATSGPTLLGGDLNTTTYDLQSPARLAKNVLRKLIVDGFAGAIAHYLTPERHYERPVFETLARHGFMLDGFNDRAQGTIRYDFNDDYVLATTRREIGGVLTAILRRKLRPWGYVVPARLDWFAGRGLAARRAGVVEARGASDHQPIVVELRS